MGEQRGPYAGTPEQSETALARRSGFTLLLAILAVGLSAVGLTESTSGAAAASCPNELLRSEAGSLALPDCRAYEKVTPATKNGAEFNTSLAYVGIGPKMAFESFATFGGAEFTGYLGASYEFSRDPAGWTISPLGGSAVTFEGTDFTTPLYALGEAGASLLGLRTRGTPVDGESLYVQQGRTTTEIGPEAPPASLVGKPDQELLSYNQNLGYFTFQLTNPAVSHVVFELFSPFAMGEPDHLWPFDATSDGFFSSAYEYVGVGNKAPFLVAVRGGQGSTDLISGCGSSIGSLSGLDTYNALSADGSVVFFTAAGEDLTGPCASPVAPLEHTELFARVDGEKPSAHTVAISEPTSADCTDCQTASRSAAVFQGASQDGSRVFFLTEQELLPGNPGKNLYEYNSASAPGSKVVAVSHLASSEPAGVLGVSRISADGTHAYFVATSVLTEDPNSTGAIAQLGDNNLYVFNSTDDSIRYVATLSAADEGAWNAIDIERQMETNPNGRYLLFASKADLTPDDTSAVSQLFRYDAATGDLTRVSVGQAGFNDNGNTDVDPVTMPRQFGKYAFGQNSPPQQMMSVDGTSVFFESSKGLTPKALDHAELPNKVGLFAQNVYEWDHGQISLISDGRDRSFVGTQNPNEQRSSVHLVGITPGGEDALFTTASPLVSTDKDQSQDVYDARVGGGLPVDSGFGCAGDVCQGLAGVVPIAASPGSAAFSGPGNKHASRRHRHHRKHRRHKHQRRHHSGGHQATRGGTR